MSDEICRDNDQGTESKAWREKGVRKGVVKRAHLYVCMSLVEEKRTEASRAFRLTETLADERDEMTSGRNCKLCERIYLCLVILTSPASLIAFTTGLELSSTDHILPHKYAIPLRYLGPAKCQQ